VVVDMDVSEGRRSDDAVPGRDLLALTIGVAEIGARGLRLALGRAVPGEKLYDVALGAAVVSGGMAVRAVDSVRSVVAPLASRLLQPPTLSVPLVPRGRRIVEDLEQRGRRTRVDSFGTVQRVIDILVPVIAEALVSRIDVEALLQEHVDIETVISTVDLDAVIEAVDLDRVAARLDIDAVLDRIDLNAIVRDRVDLDTIVGTVDIAAVLDRIDLNAIVRDRVDLDTIVATVDIDAVAARLNLEAVIERLNLPVIAQDVIDEIDLPVIIRESSGSMASEAVRGVRMHSIDADEAVHRALDRVLRHRRGNGGGTASHPDLPPADVEVTLPVAVAPMGVAEPSTRPTS
jgi:hypothetical protein